MATVTPLPRRALNQLLAVGMPGKDAVDVFFPGGRSQRLTVRGLGLVKVGIRTRFGAAAATADLNGDGLTDLVVGAPGDGLGNAEDENSDTWITPPGIHRPPQKSGRAWILFAGRRGFAADRIVRLPLPGRLGDLLGWSVTISGGPDGSHEVWVGAPGLTVKGRPEAGAVYRVSISAAGVPRWRDTLTAASPAIGSGAAQDDQVGRVLAAARHGVMVGVPHATVSAVREAGVVVRVRTDPSSGALLRGQVLSQDSPGMPDRAETEDHFGTSVSEDGLVVGIPGEGFGKAGAAGAAQVLQQVSGNRLAPGALLDRSGPGLPGPVTYSHFGHVVAVGRFACGSRPGVAVTDSRTNGDAVSVTVIPLSTKGCPATVMSPSQADLSHLRIGDGTLTDLTVDHAAKAAGDGLVIGFGGADDAVPAGTGRVVVWRGRTLGELVATRRDGDFFGFELSTPGA